MVAQRRAIVLLSFLIGSITRAQDEATCGCVQTRTRSCVDATEDGCDGLVMEESRPCQTGSNYLVVNQGKTLLLVDIEAGYTSEVIFDDNTVSYKAHAVDWTRGILFIAGYQDGATKIWKKSIDDLNNLSLVVEVGSGSATLDLDVDWLEGKIYYANYRDRTIRRVNFDGSFDEEVHQASTNNFITSVAVDPCSRRYYYVHRTENTASELHVGTYDGTSNTRVSSSLGGRADFLAFDPVDRRLFLCGYFKLLSVYNPDDDSVTPIEHDLRPNTTNFKSLAIKGDSLYISETNSACDNDECPLLRLPKDGGNFEEITEGPLVYYEGVDLAK